MSQTMRIHAAPRISGFGLIELMIGILLGSILLLGLAKVFSASRETYQASEGLARVQENGRFAVDFLQRDVRMAGHMGCVADIAHFQQPNQPEFFSHFMTAADRAASPPTFDNAPYALRFHIAVEGYEANGTAPTDSVTLPIAGAWTPTLPVLISGAANPPTGGSDVIMLRYFGTDAARVTAIDLSTNKVTILGADPFVAQETANGLYGIGDCAKASVFQATAAAGGVVTASVAGLNKTAFGTGESYVARELSIYRAESVAYYVSPGTNGVPALYRLRFTTGVAAGVPEELVSGIENIQILYGRDTNAGLPDGAVDVYQTAAQVNAAGVAAGSLPAAWRRVGTVRIGILSRSVNRGGTPASGAATPTGCTTANCVSVLGVNVTPPADSNVREAYETTIALRNRLFGN